MISNVGAGAFWLLIGGLGLEIVPTRLWGGFMLSVIISSVGIVFSLPLGILLADHVKLTWAFPAVASKPVGIGGAFAGAVGGALTSMEFALWP